MVNTKNNNKRIWNIKRVWDILLARFIESGKVGVPVGVVCCFFLKEFLTGGCGLGLLKI